jgi:hypothetical protein
MPLGRERYYVEHGSGHDALMRCKDCQSLVDMDTIKKLGCCNKCGNKRFMEITILTEKEMEDISTGAIDFPFRAEFMAEFTSVPDDFVENGVMRLHRPDETPS